MSKEKELVLNPLKKGKAEFNLVGKAKVSDFTFKLDLESGKEGSDWIYNSMNLGVDCGENGVIYADMMGGYGSERENKVFVHGKKKNDSGRDVDDFKSTFEIAWEDRFDEDNFESIGDMCFLTVGLEKDEKGSTVYKKFLTQYDAIQYINDTLTDEAVVNVKGSLKYQVYNDVVQVKKEITSIALSKAEEKDFKATFTQSLFLDGNAIGKPDKETNTIPIDAMVLDFVKEHNGEKIVRTVNGKKKEGCNLPLLKTFFVKITEDKEKLTKFLKLFKTKSKKITQFTVEGYFSKGELNTTEVSENDIPDDIKELIEMGYIDKDEVLNKMAFANGGAKRPEQMIIKSPHIVFKGEDTKIPSVERDDSLYTEDDVNPLLIIQQLGAVMEEKKEESKEEEIDVDKLINDAIEESNSDGNEAEEEDWLKDL
ncbi:hypothetical protein [Clostridium sp.]|uniref:hypothetical protein n=1 Tax=Clostridium sp. TaxID=1506 RepID=UPI00262EAC5E|nr:hypothetical protein [Clostridium sp.]